MNYSNSKSSLLALLFCKGCSLSLAASIVAISKHSVPLYLSLSLALLSIVGIVAVLITVILPILSRARAYSKQVQQCGFLPPPPSDRAQRICVRLARFFSWLLVGKIEIVGRENLETLPSGSYIVTPNHQSMSDVVVMPVVMNERKVRVMATSGVMSCLGGLGALVFGPMGVFAVNIDRGKGGPARLSAIKVLASGQALLMFPEGWTYLDGKTGPFKKGAVNIAKAAAAELGETTYIVPVHLRYGKYPGPWILKLPIRLQYLLLFVAFPFFRRGVKVVIGKAIASSSLPESDQEGTEQLRNAVLALDKGA